MGLEIYQIGNGKKAAQLLCESDNNFTSEILVQGHQKLNVGIIVSDAISDILSANTFSTTISALLSIYSGTITLQRRMPNETDALGFPWRDVAEWVISSSAVGEGGEENTTAVDDPESCLYRAGVKTGDHTNGVAHLRIGTS